MKTKTLILLAIVAVVTLSFTFASKKNEVETNKSASTQEPIGGFVSESSF
jgi:flagellar basal body-associated protein FliL